MSVSVGTTCEGCGRPAGDDGRAARYCSNACRQRAYRRRQKHAGPPGGSPWLLYAQLNSFVGRERELAEVAAHLRDQPLVTLVGPAGVGKTRLAMEVGLLRQRTRHRTVAVVELSRTSEAPEVHRQLAGALAELTPGGEGLLVVDNCEHLLAEAGPALTGALVCHPRLRVLTTSREPLCLPGEVVYQVGGLATTDPGGGGPSALPAVRLFADRARSVDPGFRLTEQSARQVLHLCARLDGLPLAVELAAMLIRVFPLADILHRLDDRLDLLAGGWRTGNPRHRSLRAALDWGHRLLAPGERRLAQSLSLFPGGFEADLAAAVMSRSGVASSGLRGLLSSLATKSMIIADPVDGRFRTLETMRVHGRERLRTEQDAGAVHDLVVDALIALGGEFAATAVLRPGAAARLRRERENIRAAVAWPDAGAAPRRLVLAGLLDALDVLDGVPRDDESHLVRAAGRTGVPAHLRRFVSAARSIVEAWPLVPTGARELGDWLAGYAGDAVATARCLYTVAAVLPGWPDLAEAERMGELGLSAARAGSAPGAVLAMTRAAAVLAVRTGDLGRAVLLGTDLLSTAADPPALAVGLTVLGLAAVREHQPVRGLRLLAAGAGDLPADLVAPAALARTHAAEALPPAEATTAWAAGGAVPARAAAGYALGGDWPATARTAAGPQLSEREWTVVTLVAEGLTNRQIAQRVHVSIGTVETHVRHLRTVLGLATRADLAVWRAARPG